MVFERPHPRRLYWSPINLAFSFILLATNSRKESCSFRINLTLLASLICCHQSQNVDSITQTRVYGGEVVTGSFSIVFVSEHTLMPTYTAHTLHVR